MHKDPICGMNVDEKTSYKTEKDGPSVLFLFGEL